MYPVRFGSNGRDWKHFRRLRTGGCIRQQRNLHQGPRINRCLLILKTNLILRCMPAGRRPAKRNYYLRLDFILKTRELSRLCQDENMSEDQAQYFDARHLHTHSNHRMSRYLLGANTRKSRQREPEFQLWWRFFYYSCHELYIKQSSGFIVCGTLVNCYQAYDLISKVFGLKFRNYIDPLALNRVYHLWLLAAS